MCWQGGHLESKSDKCPVQASVRIEAAEDGVVKMVRPDETDG
jgi:hypothetical protein